MEKDKITNLGSHPSSIFPSCVPLDKSSHLSEPQYAHYSWDKKPHLKGLSEELNEKTRRKLPGSWLKFRTKSVSHCQAVPLRPVRGSYQ